MTATTRNTRKPSVSALDVNNVQPGSNSRPALLAGVRLAAHNFGSGAIKCAAALKEAWVPGSIDAYNEVRREFFIGYLTGAKGRTEEDAILMMSLKWLTKGNRSKAGKDGVMSKAQFDDMNATKKMLSVAMDIAGLESPSNRGKGRKTDKSKNADGETFANAKKVRPPKGVRVANPTNLAAYAIAAAQAVIDLVNANPKHAIATSEFGREVYNAVKDHVDCLTQIAKKYEPDATK